MSEQGSVAFSDVWVNQNQWKEIQKLLDSSNNITHLLGIMLLLTSRHILKEIIHHGTPFFVVGSTDVLQQLQENISQTFVMFLSRRIDLD